MKRLPAIVRNLIYILAYFVFFLIINSLHVAKLADYYCVVLPVVVPVRIVLCVTTNCNWRNILDGMNAWYVFADFGDGEAAEFDHVGNVLHVVIFIVDDLHLDVAVKSRLSVRRCMHRTRYSYLYLHMMCSVFPDFLCTASIVKAVQKFNEAIEVVINLDTIRFY